jgi:hypothetical protein
MLLTNIVTQLLHLDKFNDFDLNPNHQPPDPKSNALYTTPLGLVRKILLILRINKHHTLI